MTEIEKRLEEIEARIKRWPGCTFTVREMTELVDVARTALEREKTANQYCWRLQRIVLDWSLALRRLWTTYDITPETDLRYEIERRCDALEGAAKNLSDHPTRWELLQQTRIRDLEAEIAITNNLLAERNRILEKFPCPAHGPCVPHVLERFEKLEVAEEAEKNLEAQLNAALKREKIALESADSMRNAWNAACREIDKLLERMVKRKGHDRPERDR